VCGEHILNLLVGLRRNVLRVKSQLAVQIVLAALLIALVRLIKLVGLKLLLLPEVLLLQLLLDLLCWLMGKERRYSNIRGDKLHHVLRKRKKLVRLMKKLHRMLVQRGGSWSALHVRAETGALRTRRIRSRDRHKIAKHALLCPTKHVEVHAGE
jgi:hypothetical protein